MALQAAAYIDVEAYPLDVLGAQTDGMIGYLLEQELAILTQHAQDASAASRAPALAKQLVDPAT